MKASEESVNISQNEEQDKLLQHLFHLKGYERPDPARMTKNQQNIMRRVREANGRRRWGLADLLEVNIPWFFAEPRYGMAALFIVFASLQFWGVNSQVASRDGGEIYAEAGGLALLETKTTEIYTNSISYPDVPSDLNLFPEQVPSDSVMFVGRRSPIK